MQHCLQKNKNTPAGTCQFKFYEQYVNVKHFI